MKDLSLAILLSYLAGGFLTNAYCQTYRWDDWLGPKPERGIYLEERIHRANVAGHTRPAKARLLAATTLWPAYWVSRASLWAVRLELRLHLPPSPSRDYELPELTIPIGG